MHRHRFPMPLWNQSGVLFTFDRELGEKLGTPNVKPGDIVYIPNEKILEEVLQFRAANQQVFTQACVTREFPKALHGPDGQSLTIQDGIDAEGRTPQDRLKIALDNGWSLKPVVEHEVAPDTPPTPFTPPRPKQKPRKGVAA